MSDMYVCMYVCVYVCMHVCTKSFLKTTTNSLCVCAHLANKADSDSDMYKTWWGIQDLEFKLELCVFINMVKWLNVLNHIQTK